MPIIRDEFEPQDIRVSYLEGQGCLLDSTNNRGNETSPLTFRDVHDITYINLQLNGASLDPPRFYFLTDTVCIENKSIVIVKNKV